MACKKHPEDFRVGILLLIAFSHILCTIFVQGRMITNYTIQSDDGSCVIECVDIYKQPAFSHPLLKNHTIQMRPTSSPIGFKERSKNDIFQSWKKNGKCPKGTIPIAKSPLFNKKKTSSEFFQNRTHPMQLTPPTHEYVTVSEYIGGSYYGATASLNVWNPITADIVGEFSLSQIWVLAGQGQDLNTLEAGWQAYPSLSGRHKPRFFIYWTRDNYQSTGCYNLDCPGFVQTNNKVALGGDIAPVSTYNSKQFQIQLTIHKDKSSGNWWLRVGKDEIGYWPGSIFTSLAESSRLITWGGEIVNSRTNGKHTSTQMGSGHFSSEGYSKAAYVANLGYIDSSGATIIPDQQNLIPLITNSACYDFKFGERGTDLGLNFYFGGPGFSSQCQ